MKVFYYTKILVKKLDHFLSFTQLTDDLKLARALKRFTEKERINDCKDKVERLIYKLHSMEKGSYQ